VTSGLFTLILSKGTQQAGISWVCIRVDKNIKTVNLNMKTAAGAYSFFRVSSPGEWLREPLPEGNASSWAAVCAGVYTGCHWHHSGGTTREFCRNNRLRSY
jgi:hypothetical protein